MAPPVFIYSIILNIFGNLLGRDVLEIAKIIINYDHELLSRSDPHQIPSILAALVHTTYASCPDCDPSLRLDRGFDPLPKTLTNFNHLSRKVIIALKNPRGRPLVN